MSNSNASQDTVFGLTKEVWLNTYHSSNQNVVDELVLENHQSHDNDEDFLDFVSEGAKSLRTEFVKRLI